MSEPTTVLATEATYHEGVRCVQMPCCGFTFDAGHTDWGTGDEDELRYTCPLCAPARLLRGETEMGETIIQPVIDRPCPKCFCWSLAVDCRVPDVVYCERCAPAPSFTGGRGSEGE